MCSSASTHHYYSYYFDSKKHHNKSSQKNRFIYINSILTSTFVILVAAQLIEGKIFSNCELAIELYVNQKIEWKYIPDWVCIANSATGSNTSYIQNAPPGSNHTNYGIFRISQKYWCHDGFEENNGCGMNCTELLGDDITNTVKCAKLIYTNDNQFDAWSDWRLKCKDKDVKKFVKDCKVIPGQKAPVITTINALRNKTFTSDIENQYLACEAAGIPPPDVTWKYNRTEFPDLFTKKDDEPQTANNKSAPAVVSKLFFPKASPKYIGQDFECLADNLGGQTSSIFSINAIINGNQKLQNDRVLNGSSFSGQQQAIMIGLPLFILVSSVAGTILIYRRCWVKRQLEALAAAANIYSSTVGLTDEEIKEFEYGCVAKSEETINYSYICSENIIYSPYNKLYEVDDDAITIDNTKILGSGQFGIVMKGIQISTGQPIAVKTLKSNVGNKLYLKALLSELKIMIYLGTHPCIVNLIGAKTKQLNQGLVYIFVEFCELGDLEHYLRKRKESFVDLQTIHYINQIDLNGTLSSSTLGLNGGGGGGSSTSSSSYQMNIYDHDPLTTIDLYQWSCQIASGMEYLASKKVIHGDLATRNILLVNKSTVKITDFGLAKQLYNYNTNYIKSPDTPLPWRWLAIESLREMCFSTQSDVWAFGVTLWEIFSLGEVPFSTATTFSLDFIAQLQDGKLRLLKPKATSEELYQQMSSCWSLNPQDRPTFENLHCWLQGVCKMMEISKH